MQLLNIILDQVSSLYPGQAQVLLAANKLTNVANLTIAHTSYAAFPMESETFF